MSENHKRVTPFRVPIFRDFRTVLYAGFLSDGYDVLLNYIAWNRSLLGLPFSHLAGLVLRRFPHTFACAVHSHLLGAVAASG
jgi:hypothetical protein